MRHKSNLQSMREPGTARNLWMIERLANAEAHILHAQTILANYECKTCNNVGSQFME